MKSPLSSYFTSLGLITLLFVLSTFNVQARPNCEKTKNDLYFSSCEKKVCCQSRGGISYCDSLAGRFVCQNGGYSTCYCTRHAVMDLQKIKGCCLWQGGVLKAEENGPVVCNNGAISETCSAYTAFEKMTRW